MEARERKRLLDELRVVASVEFSNESTSVTDQLAEGVVGNCLRPVDKISFGSELYQPGAVEKITRFPEARKLFLLHNADNVDFGPLSCMENVELFFIEESIVGDISFVKDWANLRELRVVEASIDTGLDAIGELTAIKTVDISLVSLPFSDQSFDLFCNAESLEFLKLEHNYGFDTLEDLSPLTKLRNLKYVSGLLQKGNKTHEAIAKLLPKDCEIVFRE